MERETLEARLASMHEALVQNLLDALQDNPNANDKRLALDLIKYNNVRDLRTSPESKIPDLAEEIPFPLIDQETDI